MSKTIKKRYQVNLDYFLPMTIIEGEGLSVGIVP